MMLYLTFLTYILTSCVTGKAVGKFMVNLHDSKGISYSDMHLVGHSLGGHVVGFAGKTVTAITGSKVAKITALDPAGPLFNSPYKTSADRLGKDDAEAVVVVHTDGKLFGYFDPLGTVDFYPNGGVAFQPGCSALDFILKQNLWCGHQKSRSFFSESINHVKYLAVRCDSWSNFIRGYCNRDEVIEFSENVAPNASGSYYFKTEE